MVSTLAQNARKVGSIPTLGTIFPIFITHYDTGAVINTLNQLRAVWLLNLPCVSKCIACIYVIVSIKKTWISSGKSSSLH